MLGLEDFVTIQALVKRGVYLCVPGGETRGRPRGPAGSARKPADPYRAVIDGLVAEGRVERGGDLAGVAGARLWRRRLHRPRLSPPQPPAAGGPGGGAL
jgi:hypothetical protein